MASEKILFEVTFDQSTAKAKVIDLEKQIIELKKEQQDLTAAYKSGLISVDEYTAANFELKEQMKDLSGEQKSYQRDLDLSNQAIKANANSYAQLTASLNLAQKQLKEMEGTLERNEEGSLVLTDAYKEQAAKVTELKEAQLEFDKTIKDGRTNVGNYEKSIEDALKNFNLFGITTENVSNIIKDGFSGALKSAKGFADSLWKTLITNPATAIFVGLAAVLTTIVGAFLSTEQGANKLNQVFARFKPIIDAVYSTLAKLGEYAFFVVDKLSEGFAFLSDNILGTSLEAGAQLTKQLQDVEKQLILINAQDKLARAEAEKLKSIRDDESKSYKERIDANTKLGKLEQDRVKKSLDAEKEKLRILEAEFKRLPENLRTTEALAKVEEQRAKVAEVSEDFFGRITEQITNQVSLLRDSLTLQADIRSGILEQQILQGKIKEGSKEELNARKKDTQDRLDAELKVFDAKGKYNKLSRDERLKILAQENENAQKIIIDSQNTELQLQKDFNDKQAALYKEDKDKRDEAEAKRKEAEKLAREQAQAQNIAFYQNRVNEATAGTKAELDAQIGLLVTQGAIEIQQAGLIGNQLLAKQSEIRKGVNDLIKEYNQAQLDDAIDFADKVLEEQQNLANEQILVQTNQLTTEKLIINQKEAELDKTIQNEDARNIQKLQIRQTFAETLKAQEIQLANDELAFQLSFEADSDAQKEQLRLSHQQKLLDIDSAYSTQRIELSNALRDAEIANLQAYADVAGQAAGLFEESTIAYKLFASAQAIISTYLAATKTLQAFAGVPIPGYAILQVITTIATGLASVAKINGVKFEDGGLLKLGAGGFKQVGVFGGKSHSSGGTKGVFEDGTRIEVEKGEMFAVVNKTNTAAIQNLSNLNSMGGNGIAFAENGGLFDSNISQMGMSVIETANSNLRQMEYLSLLPRPIVEVTEIRQKIKDVQVAESAATS